MWITLPYSAAMRWGFGRILSGERKFELDGFGGLRDHLLFNKRLSAVDTNGKLQMCLKKTRLAIDRLNGGRFNRLRSSHSGLL